IYMKASMCSRESGSRCRRSSKNEWIPCRHMRAGIAYFDASRRREASGRMLGGEKEVIVLVEERTMHGNECLPLLVVQLGLTSRFRVLRGECLFILYIDTF